MPFAAFAVNALADLPCEAFSIKIIDLFLIVKKLVCKRALKKMDFKNFSTLKKIDFEKFWTLKIFYFEKFSTLKNF